MSLSKEPKAETFQYGFLTSQTARILRRQPSSLMRDEESSRLLDQAKVLMDKILSGEAIISGGKSSLIPSIEALETFHYGVEALTVMERMQDCAKPSLGEEDANVLRGFFEDIRNTLTAVSANPNAVDTEKVIFAAEFFDAIADALLDEAIGCSRPDFAPA